MNQKLLNETGLLSLWGYAGGNTVLVLIL